MYRTTWHRDRIDVSSPAMSVDAGDHEGGARIRGKGYTKRVDLTQLEKLRERLMPATGIGLVIYFREGMVFRVIAGNEEVVIGRGEPQNAHHIAISDPTLSWEHARFIRSGDHLDVEDLGSANGTYVVGHRITGRTRLFPGAEVQMGSVISVVTPGSRNQPSLLPHSRFLAAVQEEAMRASYYGRDFAVLMVRALRPHSIEVRHFLADMLTHLHPFHALAVHSKDTVEVLLPEADVEEARKIATMLGSHKKRNWQHEPHELAVSGIVCGMSNGSGTPFEAKDLLSEILALLPENTNAERPRIECRMARRDGSFVSTPSKLFLSSKLLERLGKLDSIARSTIPVLLEGETGVGKSEIARYLHAHSKNAAGKLIAVNCAAIPDGLLEAELFGQVEGAFTGAKNKPGLFELADAGTLFLDEIGELSASAQAKILEAVQSGEFRRVGGTKTIQANVRLISATNKNLRELVKRKQFRDDLFYRLARIELQIPPLRERIDEIESLASWLLSRRKTKEQRNDIQGFSEATMQLFRTYRWPGNVRELESVIDRAVALCDHSLLEPEDFPGLLQGDEPQRPQDAPSEAQEDFAPEESARLALGPAMVAPRRRTSSRSSARVDALVAFEREQILTELARMKGNRSHAAEQLGIPIRTFYYRLKCLKITPDEIERWVDAGGKPTPEHEV